MVIRNQNALMKYSPLCNEAPMEFLIQHRLYSKSQAGQIVLTPCPQRISFWLIYYELQLNEHNFQFSPRQINNFHLNKYETNFGI